MLGCEGDSPYIGEPSFVERQPVGVIFRALDSFPADLCWNYLFGPLLMDLLPFGVGEAISML